MNTRRERSIHARATRAACENENENDVDIPLTEEQRTKLQELIDRFPNRTEEEVAAFALETGVEQCLESERESAEEEGDKLSEGLDVPPSLTVRLSTRQRLALERILKPRSYMNFEMLAKIIVRAGVAAVVEKYDPEPAPGE